MADLAQSEVIQALVAGIVLGVLSHFFGERVEWRRHTRNAAQSVANSLRPKPRKSDDDSEK